MTPSWPREDRLLSSQAPSDRFRRRVSDIYDELHPRANDALIVLLRRVEIASSIAAGQKLPTLGRGLEIRNMGRAAGQCRPDGTVVINSQLIDWPDDVRDTVAHELAHAVVETARRQLLAQRRWRGNRDTSDKAREKAGEWSVHGALWKTVARELGDSGDRCHKLPLKPLRHMRRFLYRADCGTEVVLSTVRHHRLQRDRTFGYVLKRKGVRVFGRHFVGEVE